jgi:hypothetical protein
MTTTKPRPSPLAEAAGLAVELAQAKECNARLLAEVSQARALLRRAISDRRMMEGAYVDGPLVGQIARFLDAVE